MDDIDILLAEIQKELDQERETEQDMLAEIRTHLEESVATEMASGVSREQALAQAAKRFGVGKQVGRELRAAHFGQATTDAVIVTALPVLLALILRWLIFAPDGTAFGWQQILTRPTFWIVTIAALAVPLLRFARWRYALATWSFFWLMTVVFALGSPLQW